MENLKKTLIAMKKGNIHYLIDENGSLKKYRRWSGDISSFLYDRIMEKSVFPGKFKGDINKHFDILKKELRDIHFCNILEIATGSGTAARILNRNIRYTGVDISPNLLKIASSRFRRYGFKDVHLFNVPAEDLPFKDHCFDFALCNLSLNFFKNVEQFASELKRVLKPGAGFFCSVPVPERKPAGSKIRGILYSEAELKTIFEKCNFSFEPRPYMNGALLYFSAVSCNPIAQMIKAPGGSRWM